MNLKRLLNFTTTVMFFIIIACTKNDNSNGSTNKIKSITEQDNSPNSSPITTYYTYDSNDRLIKSVKGNQTIIYYYISNLYCKSEGFSSNNLFLTTEYFLNSNHLVDSVYSQVANNIPFQIEKYTYNANNQLIDLKTYEYSTTYGWREDINMIYNYNSGNAISKLVIFQPSDTTKNYFTYESGLKNYSNYPSFAPQTSINLLKTTSTIDQYGVGGTLTHLYTKDNQGRVLTETQTSAQGYKKTINYTYY